MHSIMEDYAGEYAVTLIVITGPPCAGKSTWVMERAGADDVVIDLDRIAVAFSGPDADTHGHRGSIRAVAMAAREAALEEILKDKLYNATDVYLIHSNPGRGALGTYEFHGATVVELDPGRSVVESRCRTGRPPESMIAVEKFYGRRQKSSRVWS